MPSLLACAQQSFQIEHLTPVRPKDLAELLADMLA